MTITEFLEARIAEDEARAKYVSEYGDTGGLFTPTRVLAECAAKRAIIAEHAPVDPCDAHDAMFSTITCDTIRALAAVYADHPDYQQEWAPNGE